jgi:GPH family glycoside/pentoside/hexuronide:cation symporter
MKETNRMTIWGVQSGDAAHPPGRWRRLKDWYAHRVSPDEPSRKELVSYASGVTAFAATDTAMHTFSTQIWVMNLGLDPRAMGVIHAIKMVWDGINDSLFGHITDNWRGRWGRRRPFIAIGGVLYGLLLMGYWWVDPTWNMKQLLIWYTVALFLMEGAQTVCAVPYYALGLELSPSYAGRTRVMTYREIMARIIFYFGGWLKPLALLGAFGGILYGARAICAVLGVLVIITTVYSAVTCKERIHVATTKPKEPFLKAIAATANNRHFWRLMAVNIVLGVNAAFFNQFMLYLTVGYVFGGNQGREALYSAVLSLLGNTVSLSALPISAWISRHIGKHRALALLLLSMIVGSLLKLVCLDPGRPYLLVVLLVFGLFGQKGGNMLIPSMWADVVDTDELNQGRRREGLFGGVASVISKATVSIAAALAGFIIALSGYQAHLKLNQAPETFHNMLLMAAIGPACCLLLVMGLLWRYPLTETRMKEIRVELDRRRAANGKASLSG